MWNEDFEFDVSPEAPTLDLTCKSHVEGADDVPLGVLTIPAKRLPEGAVVQQWYPLHDRDEPTVPMPGALSLRLVYTPPSLLSSHPVPTESDVTEVIDSTGQQDAGEAAGPREEATATDSEGEPGVLSVFTSPQLQVRDGERTSSPSVKTGRGDGTEPYAGNVAELASSPAAGAAETPGPAPRPATMEQASSAACQSPPASASELPGSLSPMSGPAAFLACRLVDYFVVAGADPDTIAAKAARLSAELVRVPVLSDAPPIEGRASRPPVPPSGRRSRASLGTHAQETRTFLSHPSLPGVGRRGSSFFSIEDVRVGSAISSRPRDVNSHFEFITLPVQKSASLGAADSTGAAAGPVDPLGPAKDGSSSDVVGQGSSTVSDTAAIQDPRSGEGSGEAGRMGEAESDATDSSRGESPALKGPGLISRPQASSRQKSVGELARERARARHQSFVERQQRQLQLKQERRRRRRWWQRKAHDHEEMVVTGEEADSGFHSYLSLESGAGFSSEASLDSSSNSLGLHSPGVGAGAAADVSHMDQSRLEERTEHSSVTVSARDAVSVGSVPRSADGSSPGSVGSTPLVAADLSVGSGDGASRTPGADDTTTFTMDEESPDQEGVLLHRYPPWDYPDLPLPEKMEWFCLPCGAAIVEARGEHTDAPPPAHFSTFLLNPRAPRQDTKLHGVCFTFYVSVMAVQRRASEAGEEDGPDVGCEYGLHHEEIGAEYVAEDEVHTIVAWAPRTMCLLTRLPFVPQLQRALWILWQTGTGQLNSVSPKLKLEDLLVTICHEVPLPVPGFLATTFDFGPLRLSVSLPPIGTCLPAIAVNTSMLFDLLAIRAVAALIAVLLAEEQVLVHSSRPWLLYEACESLLSLLFPLKWPHTYIPVLPHAIAGDYVQAPVPFVLGVHTASMATMYPPDLERIVVVDLDRGLVGPGGGQWLISKRPNPGVRCVIGAVSESTLASSASVGSESQTVTASVGTGDSSSVTPYVATVRPTRDIAQPACAATGERSGHAEPGEGESDASLHHARAHVALSQVATAADSFHRATAPVSGVTERADAESGVRTATPKGPPAKETGPPATEHAAASTFEASADGKRAGPTRQGATARSMTGNIELLDAERRGGSRILRTGATGPRVAGEYPRNPGASRCADFPATASCMTYNESGLCPFGHPDLEEVPGLQSLGSRHDSDDVSRSQIELREAGADDSGTVIGCAPALFGTTGDKLVAELADVLHSKTGGQMATQSAVRNEEASRSELHRGLYCVAGFSGRVGTDDVGGPDQLPPSDPSRSDLHDQEDGEWESATSRTVRLTFAQFFAAVLEGFRDCLFFPRPGMPPIFNHESFLADTAARTDLSEGDRELYLAMFRSQAFAGFLADHDSPALAEFHTMASRARNRQRRFAPGSAPNDPVCAMHALVIPPRNSGSSYDLHGVVSPGSLRSALSVASATPLLQCSAMPQDLTGFELPRIEDYPTVIRKWPILEAAAVLDVVDPARLSADRDYAAFEPYHWGSPVEVIRRYNTGGIATVRRIHAEQSSALEPGMQLSWFNFGGASDDSTQGSESGESRAPAPVTSVRSAQAAVGKGFETSLHPADAVRSARATPGTPPISQSSLDQAASASTERIGVWSKAVAPADGAKLLQLVVEKLFLGEDVPDSSFSDATGFLATQYGRALFTALLQRQGALAAASAAAAAMPSPARSLDKIHSIGAGLGVDFTEDTGDIDGGDVLDNLEVGDVVGLSPDLDVTLGLTDNAGGRRLPPASFTQLAALAAEALRQCNAHLEYECAAGLLQAASAFHSRLVAGVDSAGREPMLNRLTGADMFRSVSFWLQYVMLAVRIVDSKRRLASDEARESERRRRRQREQLSKYASHGSVLRMQSIVAADESERPDSPSDAGMRHTLQARDAVQLLSSLLQPMLALGLIIDDALTVVRHVWLEYDLEVEQADMLLTLARNIARSIDMLSPVVSGGDGLETVTPETTVTSASTSARKLFRAISGRSTSKTAIGGAGAGDAASAVPAARGQFPPSPSRVAKQQTGDTLKHISSAHFIETRVDGWCDLDVCLIPRFRDAEQRVNKTARIGIRARHGVPPPPPPRRYRASALQRMEEEGEDTCDESGTGRTVPTTLEAAQDPADAPARSDGDSDGDSDRAPEPTSRLPPPVEKGVVMRSWQPKMECVVMQGHPEEAGITSVDCWGDSVASAGRDGTVCLWDIGAKAHVHSLKQQKTTVNDIRHVRGLVATAGVDGSLRVIRRIVAGKRPRTTKLKGHRGSVLVCDAWAGVQEDEAIVVSGGIDGTVRVWAGNKMKCAHILRAHASVTGPRTGVQSLALARDARHVVSGGNDSTAILWDVEVGVALGAMRGHTESVMACSIDERRVVTAGADGTLRVWDPRTLQSSNILVGHTDVVRCFSTGGSAEPTIVSGGDDRTVRVWDVRSATGGSRLTLHGHLDSVSSLAWDWAKIVTGAGGSDATVRLWALQTGKCLRVCKGHTQKISGVHLKSTYVLSASWDGTVRAWYAPRE